VETRERIRRAAAEFSSMGLGPCIEVDTSAPVDIKELVKLLS
jgi:hypothetical protein